MSVAHSDDGGKTWGEPILVYSGGCNGPRIQKLRDGTILLLIDAYGDPGKKREFPVVIWDSTDEGKTWTNECRLRPRSIGGNCTCVPSRVTELPDGSWLMVGLLLPR